MSALRISRDPNISQEMATAAGQVLRGLPFDTDRFALIDPNFYSRVDYPAAGASRLNFFVGSPVDGIANLEQSGIPSGRVFFLRAIRITLEDATIAGAPVAAGAIGAATNAPLVTRANEVKHLLQQGRLLGRVGDFVVADAHGLHRFPSGGGVDVNMAATTTATTTTITGAAINNGQPNILNQYVLPAPYIVLPQVRLDFSANWNTLAVLTGGGVLKLELAGALLIDRITR